MRKSLVALLIVFLWSSLFLGGCNVSNKNQENKKELQTQQNTKDEISNNGQGTPANAQVNANSKKEVWLPVVLVSKLKSNEDVFKNVDQLQPKDWEITILVDPNCSLAFCKKQSLEKVLSLIGVNINSWQIQFVNLNKELDI